MQLTHPNATNIAMLAPMSYNYASVPPSGGSRKPTAFVLPFASMPAPFCISNPFSRLLESVSTASGLVVSDERGSVIVASE
jgi:hypothetical protein